MTWKLYTTTCEGVIGLVKAWFYIDGTFASGDHAITGGWNGSTFHINGYNPTGAEETCYCEVAGVLFYDHRLAPTDQQAAEGYMRDKYLGAGLPTTGGWIATATATVVHTSTITSSWGTWDARAIADPIAHGASINSNWGTWQASALGSQLGQAVAFITTNWGSWTATATAQPILHYGTVNTVWSWTTTATAVVSHTATVVSAWGTWTATAIAQPIQRNATIASSWGTWTASATAVRTTAASISSSWGTWTASANGVVVAEEIFATVSTNWGAWTATATATSFHITSGAITTNWGTWAATAAAGVAHFATITTTWGTWDARAVAQPIVHPASISTTWGTWAASATCTVTHPALINTVWAWTATATANVQRFISINTIWDTVTFTASAVVGHSATGYSNFGRWEATAEGIAAPRGTTINEADMIYLGDEEVDRIFLDGVIVWELV
jgi:hypothetical protein